MARFRHGSSLPRDFNLTEGNGRERTGGRLVTSRQVSGPARLAIHPMLFPTSCSAYLLGEGLSFYATSLRASRTSSAQAGSPNRALSHIPPVPPLGHIWRAWDDPSFQHAMINCRHLHRCGSLFPSLAHPPPRVDRYQVLSPDVTTPAMVSWSISWPFPLRITDGGLRQVLEDPVHIHAINRPPPFRASRPFVSTSCHHSIPYTFLQTPRCHVHCTLSGRHVSFRPSHRPYLSAPLPMPPNSPEGLYLLDEQSHRFSLHLFLWSLIISPRGPTRVKRWLRALRSVSVIAIKAIIARAMKIHLTLLSIMKSGRELCRVDHA